MDKYFKYVLKWDLDEQQLQFMGKCGWEHYAVLVDPNGRGIKYFFKKQVKQEDLIED